MNPYRQLVAQQQGRPQQRSQGNLAPQRQPQPQRRQANLQVVEGQGAQQYQQPQGGYPQGQDRLAVRPIQRHASHHQEQHYDPSGTYNPMAYGGEQWRDGLSRAVPSAHNRLFNKKGELNADNKKDALQQIAYLLQNVTRQDRQARFYREANEMPQEDRRQVLAAAMKDPEGFAILGQELLLPIKDIVDYEGWARKVYRVRPLAQGEFFRIAKDVRATAWLIGQDGQGIESRLHGKFVQPAEFKLASFPSVDIEDIYTMNYDVLDRAQDTARQEIELEEDKRGRILLDLASTTVNTAVSFGSLGVSAFEDVRFQVERHRLVVEKFLINRQELSDIVKTMSAAVDPVTERELILAGYIGSFLNAQIITTAGTGVEEVVPAGTFYAVTGPEYLGELGIRVELFSEPYNMFSQQRLVKGWAFAEIVGFVISNPRAVAKGVK